jgi:hypothetical protein
MTVFQVHLQTLTIFQVMLLMTIFQVIINKFNNDLVVTIRAIVTCAFKNSTTLNTLFLLLKTTFTTLLLYFYILFCIKAIFGI